MSTNQKLELSRELRQWIGTIIGLGSTAIFIWMAVDPVGFEQTVSKIRNRFRR